MSELSNLPDHPAVGQLFRPVPSGGRIVDHYTQVFGAGGFSTGARARALWRWTMAVAEEMASGCGGQPVLERSPYSAFAVATSVVPHEMNEALLARSWAHLGQAEVIHLRCPKPERDRRLANRPARHDWHPMREPRSYVEEYERAYERLGDFLPHRVVRSDAPLAEVVAQVRQLIVG